jgi:hypothetical protein
MYQYPIGKFRRMKMSHMIATSEVELHQMAKRIGVARRWYQGDHYDICMSKRDLAFKHGAVSVSMRQLAGILHCLRNELDFTTPQSALDLMLHPIREKQRGRA